MSFSHPRAGSLLSGGARAVIAATLLVLSGWNVVPGQTATAQSSADPAGPPAFDFAKYAKQYFGSALSPQNLISSVAASTTGAALHTALHDFSTDEFQQRVAENVARKGVAGSIEFVTASLLQQDVHFVASHDHGFRTRVKYALFQTFITRGREGNELAVPRIAASFGTAWALDAWHPWMKNEPNIWSHAGFIFGSYAVRSFWTEFKPDIKHELQTVLKRNRAGIQP
jgi:hypothetical protein